MKLLFDENLSGKLCTDLADIFPGSSHVRAGGLQRADDRTVWEYARTNGFVLVSLDADFAELASLLGPTPKVIWLRCGNQPSSFVERLVRENFEAIRDFGRKEDAALLEVY